MVPRERVIRTLNHRSVDRAPRDLWLAPSVESERADEVAEIAIRFPCDILHVNARCPVVKRGKAAANRSDQYTDAWGCTWQLEPSGAIGPPVESPAADPHKMSTYTPPADLLDPARFLKANRNCEGASQFTLAWSECRPLDRLLAVRGPEAGLAEISAANKELRRLLATLHGCFRREIEMWTGTDADGVVLGDALASPEGLRIPARAFRQWFKPLYGEYCEMLHAKDMFAFFHTEGDISDIFDDLVEIGLDAIHVSPSLASFEQLAEKYRSRTTFWGGMDEQKLSPSSARPDIHEEVLRVRRALDYGIGGVIAQCSWGPETPLRNLAAFFEEWILPLPVGV